MRGIDDRFLADLLDGELSFFLQQVLPLAHPRQIGALGSHSERWYHVHQEWERDRVK